MIDVVGRAMEVLRNRYTHDSAVDDSESSGGCVSVISERRDRLAGEYWAGEVSDVPDPLDPAGAVREAIVARERADRQVIADYIAEHLPARVVHDTEHSALYATASTLEVVPDDVGNPGSDAHWTARAEDVGIWTELLGDSGDSYEGSDPIEDVAVPPSVPWTAADHVAALEQAIAVHGIEPGQWYEVEWPPEEANLWSPGYAYPTHGEPCDRHDDGVSDEVDDDCDDCRAPAFVVEAPAEWRFTTELRSRRLVFDENGHDEATVEVVDPAFEIRSLRQDPRCILLGAPGRGTRW